MIRLVTFFAKSSGKSTANIGSLLLDDFGKPLGVLNLTNRFGLKDSATGMLDLIERFPVHEIKEKYLAAKKIDHVLSMQDIFLQAPIPLPKRNVICVGKRFKSIESR